MESKVRFWMCGACAWVGVLMTVACGGDDLPVSDGGGEEGDGASPGPVDGAMDAAVKDASGDAQVPSIAIWPEGGFPILPASVCALAVGAQCDGDEDCPQGTMCCGTFAPDDFTYSRIDCQAECAPPDGFRLCHPGEQCADPAHECRYSQVVPHTFIQVCYEPTEPPANPRGRSIAGEVICGSTTCEVGREKCCLRALFHFVDNARIPLEPYCAPLDAACACDDQPPPYAPPDDPALDAGSDEDAS